MTDIAQRHGSPASVRRRPPDRRLPLRELVRLSIYWLGLSSIFAGLTTLLRDASSSMPWPIPRTPGGPCCC